MSSVIGDVRRYQWVENLEDARDENSQLLGGEKLYRRFRLYLWDSVQAFLSHEMDAYRVVLELAKSA